MTTPALTVDYPFVSTGASSYVIPQWIYEKSDISVYFEGALQGEANYSISVPTEGPTASYTLTLASPPASGVNILILRDSNISIPPDYSPGTPLTSNDLNIPNNKEYLQNIDNDFYGDAISLRYSKDDLAPTGSIPAGDRVLPILTTPAVGTSPVTWAKDETGAIIQTPIDPSGITAAQLEIDLAEATVTTSGSRKIGHYNALTGTATTAWAQIGLNTEARKAATPTDSGSTYIPYWTVYQNSWFPVAQAVSVQQALDVCTHAFIPATLTNSGADWVPLWDTAKGNAKSIQSFVNSMFSAATVSETGYIYDMYLWDSSRSLSRSVGGLILNMTGEPSASEPNYGAGSIKYWNGTASIDIKEALDALPTYEIGDFIPGVRTTHPTGSWRQMNKGATLSSSDGATYKPLYLAMCQKYAGKTAAQAESAYTAGDVIEIGTSTIGAEIELDFGGFQAFRYA